MGLFPTMIESDALGVVNLVNSDGIILADIGLVIQYIQTRIKRGLVKWVRFVPRKANVVAHNLAKLVLSINQNRIWLECFPPCVELCLLEDCPK